MGFIAVGLVGLAFFIINSQPISSVVLLPDTDGKAGSIIVRSDAQLQSISTAYGRASVDRRGGIKTAAEDGREIQQRYGSTLAARPLAPISFTVFFEFGSAVDIAPVFQPTLEKLKMSIGDYPAADVTVIGHTDRVGTLESNDALSVKRAETVRDLILQSGLQPAALDVAGRGEREPLVPTEDEVPEARNRRVEINLR
jgi:outer membrane protein OmpA-like peptidoglycan-associated protein